MAVATQVMEDLEDIQEVMVEATEEDTVEDTVDIRVTVVAAMDRALGDRIPARDPEDTALIIVDSGVDKRWISCLNNWLSCMVLQLFEMNFLFHKVHSNNSERKIVTIIEHGVSQRLFSEFCRDQMVFLC